MDAVTLTWRWQNILTIWAMVIVLYFAITFGAQFAHRINGNTPKES